MKAFLLIMVAFCFVVSFALNYCGIKAISQGDMTGIIALALGIWNGWNAGRFLCAFMID